MRVCELPLEFNHTVSVVLHTHQSILVSCHSDPSSLYRQKQSSHTHNVYSYMSSISTPANISRSTRDGCHIFIISSSWIASHRWVMRFFDTRGSTGIRPIHSRSVSTKFRHRSRVVSLLLIERCWWLDNSGTQIRSFPAASISTRLCGSSNGRRVIRFSPQERRVRPGGRVSGSSVIRLARQLNSINLFGSGGSSVIRFPSRWRFSRLSGSDGSDVRQFIPQLRVRKLGGSGGKVVRRLTPTRRTSTVSGIGGSSSKERQDKSSTILVSPVLTHSRTTWWDTCVRYTFQSGLSGRVFHGGGVGKSFLYAYVRNPDIFGLKG